MSMLAEIRRGLAVSIAIFTFAFPPSALAQAAEEKGLAISVEARRRDTGFGDSSAELLMVLRGRGGDEKRRELRATTLEVPSDGNKTVVIFGSPLDVKGTALLTYSHRTGDDDQWLYLPALKRVKRIGSSNKSGPFMGSEFTYEDLASQEVEKFTHRWIRDEACPGQEFESLQCFVVERLPVDADTGYSRQVAWIDRNEYRTVQIEYYDSKASLLKTLTLTRYKQYLGRYWRANEMLMVNRQTGKSTRLIWTKYAFGTGLTESDFTPQALTRGR